MKDRYKKGFVEEPPAGYCAGGPAPWNEKHAVRLCTKVLVQRYLRRKYASYMAVQQSEGLVIQKETKPSFTIKSTQRTEVS